jgi:4-hydroxyphenylpyruvate dioxygenase
VVRRADHPGVGLILDSFHTLARKIDPETIRRIPADRIFFVQLADAPLIDMDLLYWSRHFRNMPGQGDLDLAAFMRAVAATGYDGVLSLEIFNDQFRGASTRSIAVDGRRSLIALADRVRREEPASALTLPEMPDRVPVKGVEFVEFATEAPEAETLTRMLAALGFRRSGRHVSKSVELWTQGAIHLVVNTEQEGFAHASYVLHGTNVCDVGLAVEDAAAVLERARALGADMFEQPMAPGQLAIPAIRGIGGSVLHFLDAKSDLARVWEIEFERAAGEDRGVGLVGIDHIAQSMRYEEMLTWILFYTTIFETAKTPMVDVIDPAGLVRSQVIESPDGGFRVTLNGAENARTLAGHFLAESFGSAVQHIAFRTEDIFETAAALAANGFETLEISPNYYADLGARLGLEPAMVERLKAAHILYDRDDGGAYFQLYSRTWGEGFFFEIVERRGGYGGYGAVNAPFRIAAQKRGMRPAGMPKM